MIKEWIPHWNDGEIVLYQLHCDHGVKDSKGRKIGHYARLCMVSGSYQQYIQITRNGEVFGPSQNQHNLKTKDLSFAKDLTENKLNELHLKVLRKYS